MVAMVQCECVGCGRLEVQEREPLPNGGFWSFFECDRCFEIEMCSGNRGGDLSDAELVALFGENYWGRQ